MTVRIVQEIQAWRLALAHLAASLLLPPFSARTLRALVFRLGGIALVPGVQIGGGVTFGHRNVSLDRGTYIGPGTFFTPTPHAGVHIGAKVAVGPRCHFITTTHDIGGPDARAARPVSMPVHVADGVWIGADVTVLPGVTIGCGAVIAAGSVVTKDVAPSTLVAGVPASEQRALPLT